MVVEEESTIVDGGDIPPAKHVSIIQGRELNRLFNFHLAGPAAT